MTCEELSREYEEQAIAIDRMAAYRMIAAAESRGEALVQLRRELKILESMARDCRYAARQLKSYGEGVKADENGFHRQGLVGVYHAMPYTLKRFVLRSGTTNGVED